MSENAFSVTKVDDEKKEPLIEQATATEEYKSFKDEFEERGFEHNETVIIQVDGNARPEYIVSFRFQKSGEDSKGDAVVRIVNDEVETVKATLTHEIDSDNPVVEGLLYEDGEVTCEEL